jgi:hypothetical protein
MVSNPQVEVPGLGQVSLTGIANRNERRVSQRLPIILREFPELTAERLAIQDCYALALNLLPPRYAQAFSIVLNEPVTDKEIDAALRVACARVLENLK